MKFLSRSGLGKHWQYAYVAVLAAGFLRTSWLATVYFFRWDDVQRHHVESAWFVQAGLLVILALIAGFRHSGTWQKTTVACEGKLPPWSTAAFIAISFAAFWPSVSVGLLSDDFVLLERARQGIFFADSHWPFVRPVSLSVFWIVREVVPEPRLAIALHSVNIALHGLNGSLLARLGVRLGAGPTTASLAGLFFLLFPLNTEAVTWIAGSFDVLLLTWVLLLALLVMGSSDEVSGHRRIAAVAVVGILALGTKETAVAVPALLIPPILLRGGWKRTASWRDVALLGLETTMYIGWRLLQGVPRGMFPTLSSYTFKEFLSRPFAALGVPFHERLIEATAMWTLPGAVGLPLLFTVFAWRWWREPRGARLSLALVLWIVIAVGPVFAMLFISPELQGSRYLYVSSAGWALLIAWSLHEVNRSPARRIAFVLMLSWFALSSIALRAHQSAWTEAARVRDRVLQQVLQAPEDCEAIAFRRVPDNVGGAYVFRNGLAEAMDTIRPHLRLVEPEELNTSRCLVAF